MALTPIVDISEIILEMGLTESITEIQRAVITQAQRRAEAAIRRYLRYDPTQQSRTEFYPMQDFSLGDRERIWEVSDTTAFVRGIAAGQTSELFVRHIPIRSVTSLFIDYDGRSGTKSGAFDAESEKTEGEDFWPNYDMLDSSGNSVCNDGIIRSQGLWPTVPGSVKIVYTAGYTDDELRGEDANINAAPIRDAVITETVRRALRTFVRGKKVFGFVAGPLQSENLGSYSYSRGTAEGESLSYGGQGLSTEAIAMLEEFVNWGWELAA